MIHTLTLNPAIDKILYIEKFERTVTARIQNIKETIGGKGTHVSVNLGMMGVKNRALGIAHGDAGNRLIEMLKTENVDVCFLHRTYQNTRTNYLLAEHSGDATLITERGVELSKQDIDDVIQTIKKVVKSGDYLVFSGDASNYADPAVYNSIVQGVADCGLKIFMDTSGKTLRECVKCAPFLIKPNLDELSALCEYEVQPTKEDVIHAIRMLDHYNIPIVAVSLGAEGSVTRYFDVFYHVEAPRINPVNTVGCGDCYLAGLLCSLEKGENIEDALKFATATGAAAAECSLSVGLDIERARELKEQVVLKKI